ncbi:MAG: ribonuclease D [Kordiimonas sp.]|nr:ribonuclease D [Kordiimonas sp.]
MTTIKTTDELAALCARLATAPYITVDTEFKREKTYWAQLCLIQVASPDEYWAIDPLVEGLDLKPFYDLMANENVLKVFHAARQDIEIFVKEAGVVPQPLFDTQVAAMVCGFGESVGYEKLVLRLTNATLDKSVRFTDWSRRPLTEKQLNYALGDVIHLRDVYRALDAMLVKNGRQSWLAEEMAILTAAETYISHPEDAWRRLKTRSNNRRFLAIVQTLAAWREVQAQSKDVPRNRIIRDDVLFEIAAHPPTDVAGLKQIRGLPANFEKGLQGAEVLNAVQAAMAIPEKELPQIPKGKRPPDDKAAPIVELLRVLLKLKCQDAGVASKLVATIEHLELIARHDQADVPALKGWRYELFGQDALAVKRGELGFAIRGGKLKTILLGD